MIETLGGDILPNKYTEGTNLIKRHLTINQKLYEMCEFS